MMAHKVEERRRKDRKKERKKEERWLFEKKTKSEKNEGDSLLTLLSLKPALFFHPRSSHFFFSERSIISHL